MMNKHDSVVMRPHKTHPQGVPRAACLYIGYYILNYLLRIIISPIVGSFPILMIIPAIGYIVGVSGIYYLRHTYIITKKPPHLTENKSPVDCGGRGVRLGQLCYQLVAPLSCGSIISPIIIRRHHLREQHHSQAPPTRGGPPVYLAPLSAWCLL